MKEEDFQTLYILSCQKLYGRIRSLGKSQEDSWKLLVNLYVKIYENRSLIPKDDEAFLIWAEELICQLLSEDERKDAQEIFKKNKGESAEDPVLKKISEEKMTEERSASLWMEIEERLNEDFVTEQELPVQERGIFSAFRILLAVAVVTVTAFLFVTGWKLISQYREEERLQEAMAESAEAAKESQEREQEILRIEKESRTVGWTLKEDGNLYYVNKAKEEARGAMSLGGQVFVFSHNGILTSIEEGNGVYNEDTIYYIENKDVYMKAPGEEKVCIVLNGHVEKINIFDQNLYYICTYQVPNSQKVRTAVWKADLDGKNEKMVFETMSSLSMERFQVTEQWYYYLSNGDLLRMNLKNGKTEWMCRDIDHYFVFHDVVYYMDSGVIGTVSEGEPYEDTSMYSLEADGDSFIIKDSSGQPVSGDENGIVRLEDREIFLEDGRIVSVRQKDQIFNDNTYFLKDQKIYRRSPDGSVGLLRQSGQLADSFCIAGRWLYYSAYQGLDGNGQDSSQIFRIDLEKMEEETVTQTFEGRVKTLYHSSGDSCVYGEYGPESGQAVHGRIICIPENGGMYLVDDFGQRPGGGQGDSEWMRFITSDNGRIYCLWQDCAGNPMGAGYQVISAKPMVLEREHLIYLNH